MPWYFFRQNNSGGSFIKDEEVSVNVFIQAPSAQIANRRAEKVGIYFDGCSDDRDCSCCGDRWYRVDDEDGTKTPMIYGKKAYKKNSPDHRFYPEKFFKR